MKMDWDDIRSSSSTARQVVVDETLERHSVAELEQRIKILEQEIDRVRQELKAKQEYEACAASVFKS
jgi:uncharacterized small protein (DUF1192 family)